MDALLTRLGSQAINFVMRRGIALTATFIVQQSSRLLQSVDDKGIQRELKDLQKALNNKIKVLSPAIDLVEFASGRGNVFMEGAVDVAHSLRRDIVRLGKRLEAAASTEENPLQCSSGEEQVAELSLIIRDMKDLLKRIDQDIPAIQLAISTSGVSLSASMPPGVSPSRLLQANTFLIFGDTQFSSNPTQAVQIGPSFTLSLYMLFEGHSAGPAESNISTPPATPSASGRPSRISGSNGRAPIWQEVLHKARVRVCRTPLGWTFDENLGYVPPSLVSPKVDYQTWSNNRGDVGRFDEYAYHLEIIEDLNDDRFHDEDAGKSGFTEVRHAGIRESIPIHQISKIFYADTGRILNLGGDGGLESNPILLLKRDTAAPNPVDMKKDVTLVETHEVYSSRTEIAAVEHEHELDTEQDDVDRQLAEESPGVEQITVETEKQQSTRAWQLPGYLDPEWFAFEVFEDAEDKDDDDESDEDSLVGIDDVVDNRHDSLDIPKARLRPRSSVDAKLIDQIRTVSLGSSPSGSTPDASRRTSTYEDGDQSQELAKEEALIERSPFGAITTSLSLMEMLIRLASLQECQQASYLSLPDHIITFFLEETSTTGLKGEERWRVRRETKMKVGFDPYTDTPTK